MTKKSEMTACEVQGDRRCPSHLTTDEMRKQLRHEDALHAENERLRETLKFYANANNYGRMYLGFVPGFGDHYQPSAVSDDLFGGRARKALSETGQEVNETSNEYVSDNGQFGVGA